MSDDKIKQPYALTQRIVQKNRSGIIESFNDTFNRFLAELESNVLVELSESNPTYRQMKTENEKCYEQIQTLVVPAVLSAYEEIIYELESFELNYCFLRGMRNAKKPDVISPTGEIIMQELTKYEKYRQLRDESLRRYNELLK